MLLDLLLLLFTGLFVLVRGIATMHSRAFSSCRRGNFLERRKTLL